MAQLYRAGEQKTRAGVYYRYTTNSVPTAGAIDGIAAIVINASWGPQETVTVHETISSVEKAYGSEVATMLKTAGASTVLVSRLKGTSGAKAQVNLASIGTIKAKYEGAGKSLKVKVQAKADDTTKKQVLVLDGTTLLESFEYANSADETTAIKEATAKSDYIEITTTASGVIPVNEYTLTGGQNPTVTAADYMKGFEALESYRYNVLCTDSVDTAVALLMKAYADEAATQGKHFIAVAGAPTSVEFATRLSTAKSMNSSKMVYFGSGWTTADGQTIDGAKAVAYVAGVIAATPSDESIVHSVISGAVDVTERLTNTKFVQAIENGLLLLSVGAGGEVWFDSGITTLTTLGTNEDAGWKKIKRAKVRQELFDRLDRVTAPLVGKVNCNPDGIAAVIQAGMGVISAMVAENKLMTGAEIIEDPENPYGADSAWFIINAVDVDALEKIYLHYQFSYSAN